MGLKISALICYIAAIISMLIMFVIKNNGFGMVLAVIFAIIFATALPLDTVMIPIFTSDFFGKRGYNKLLPILVSASTAGCAVGVPLWNLVYDIFGTYKPATIVFAIMLAAILALFLALVRKSEILKGAECGKNDK